MSARFLFVEALKVRNQENARLITLNLKAWQRVIWLKCSSLPADPVLHH